MVNVGVGFWFWYDCCLFLGMKVFMLEIMFVVVICVVWLLIVV